MTLKPDIDDLLRDLGEALLEAVSDSDVVVERLQQLQEAGYSLSLRVDCKPGEQDDDAEDGPGSAEGAREGAATRPAAADPNFRINTDDLSFLRSIGIDPTRKSRSRRSR